jgi:CRISPR system Cascade subunit CasE
MWISRITLNRERFSKLTIQSINDLYDEHKLIWQFFVDQQSGTRPFLFRRVDQTTFIMVSKVSPINQSNGLWVLESKKYDPVLQIGKQLRFTLRVNPVVTHLNCKKKHDVKMDLLFQKRKLGVVRETAQELLQTSVTNWLTKRQSIHGFEVIEELINVDEYLQHRIKPIKIPISTCNISGKLVVTNPDTFKNLLFSGIGKAKGFGCGLMLISQ